MLYVPASLRYGTKTRQANLARRQTSAINESLLLLAALLRLRLHSAGRRARALLRAPAFRRGREVRRLVRRPHRAGLETLLDLSDALGSFFEVLHQGVVVLVNPILVPVVQRQDRFCMLLDGCFQV